MGAHRSAVPARTDARTSRIAWLDAAASTPEMSELWVAAATHNSLISGVDTGASSQAILDVLASVRAGTALR